eukprot:scaffold81494_cov63-Phaeocystis_antarctica.AAC.1
MQRERSRIEQSCAQTLHIRMCALAARRMHAPANAQTSQEPQAMRDHLDIPRRCCLFISQPCLPNNILGHHTVGTPPLRRAQINMGAGVPRA